MKMSLSELFSHNFCQPATHSETPSELNIPTEPILTDYIEFICDYIDLVTTLIKINVVTIQLKKVLGIRKKIFYLQFCMKNLEKMKKIPIKSDFSIKKLYSNEKKNQKKVLKKCKIHA
jgi:hypothetical protein